MIISSTDADIRREHTDEFLNFYHQELEKRLAKASISMPFTLSETRNLFNQSFGKETLFLMISHVPFLLLPRLYERANDEQIRNLLKRLELAAEEACNMKSHQ
ncbi:unnamed protein product [Gongylonema pulchrum]|uniref:Uncharacterized protein n=1 Tax=Gongylonema pulchrum TaxID=637853 RepID=A0A3P6P582_9BILA|nr:unnamed protein product [Gongylonema pulchrum]